MGVSLKKELFIKKEEERFKKREKGKKKNEVTIWFCSPILLQIQIFMSLPPFFNSIMITVFHKKYILIICDFRE